MLKVWDKIRVKSNLVVGTHYWIIECLEEHKQAEGMEWEITNVVWEGQWYELSFDPWNMYWESMLELVSAKIEYPLQQPVQEVLRAPEPRVVYKRKVVSERLREYAEKIKKLEEVDRDMFFEMIYDKLESILFEEYWG